MISTASAFHGLKTKLIAVAIASVILPTGYAIAKNHDIQPIRLPPAALVLHDHAPSPVDHGAN